MPETGKETTRALQAALRYLGPRARSCLEIRRYLKNKAYPVDTIESVISRLKVRGYLNDAAFAEDWVASRLRQNPKSRWMLQRELDQKGIGAADMAAALNKVDDEKAAWQAVKNKTGRWTGLEKMIFRRRLFGFLSRRGFSSDLCRDIFKTLWEKENARN